MIKTETNLKDCYILEPQRFGDNRGYFESVTIEQLHDLGFQDIVQINHSKSIPVLSLQNIYFKIMIPSNHYKII